jgi:murein DD-endopeptidase MepM/ murein hydrolase activator NlpD
MRPSFIVLTALMLLSAPHADGRALADSSNASELVQRLRSVGFTDAVARPKNGTRPEAQIGGITDHLNAAPKPADGPASIGPDNNATGGAEEVIQEIIRIPVDATYTVRSGDTFELVLIKTGIGAAEAERAIRALAKVFDPRRLRPGHLISLALLPSKEEDTPPSLLSINFTTGPESEVIVDRARDGNFAAESRKRNLDVSYVYSGGTIESSLYVAGEREGVPAGILVTLIDLFSFDVDFQRDIRPGDSFELLYERLTDSSGNAVAERDVVSGSMNLGGKVITLYRFKSDKGRVGYFDEKGQSARKTLMRTPTDATRISSSFGRRRHPILGYTRIHRGVDFAAPTGTPVYAAGDGVVEKAGWAGGYGKYVRIRHNGTYKSAYAHLSRIARGMRAGRRVKQRQIIGFIGSTGRSTGPHLHYELIRNGRQINPRRVRLPAGYRLSGAELERFKAEISTVKERIFALRRDHRSQEAQADTGAH